jgi:succinate-acetate transporter protein
MAVLTFIFLICSFRVNIIFVLVLLAAQIAFALLAAALVVESEALEMIGEAQALGAMGNAAEAAVLGAKGMARLNTALKLVTVSH